MVWRKEGLLFERPENLSWAASHAMLPVVQRRVDGGLRVLFSSRDAGNRSHVGVAEVNLRDRATVNFAPRTLLDPGPRGAFDDSGVNASCCVEVNGKHYVYYIGWSLGVTVPFYTFIGCAMSEDGGETYSRVSPAPVVGRGPVDPYLATSPWVLVENGTWRMWYASGTAWEQKGENLRHRYHIKYAESDDGLHWRREGLVCIDYRDPDEYAIARPCVVRDGDLYRMWYSYRGAAYRIGYAESADGLSWERKDEEAGIDVSASGWDDEMIEYPFVFDHGGRRHMLYNGNGYGASGIGHAMLEDG